MDAGGIPPFFLSSRSGPLFNTCPFCNRFVTWWTEPITETMPFLRPATFSPKNLECQNCGTILMIIQVSEDRNDVIVRFTQIDRSLHRFLKLVDSLTDIGSEASKAIVYGLLGAYTKDAIDKLYRSARKQDYNVTQFEAELKDILERYEMRFCGSCGRPVKRTRAFCSHCGHAMQEHYRDWRNGGPRSQRKKSNRINEQAKSLRHNPHRVRKRKSQNTA